MVAPIAPMGSMYVEVKRGRANAGLQTDYKIAVGTLVPQPWSISSPTVLSLDA